MKLFKQIRDSVYCPDYYKKEVSTETLGQSVGYFIRLILLLALIVAVSSSFRFGNTVVNSMPSILDALNRAYPDELVLDLNDGLHIKPIIFIAVFLGYFILASLGWLLYNLLTALIVWVARRHKSPTLNYAKSYNISLHLLTLPILAGALIWIIPGIGQIRFLAIILFLLALFINFKADPSA